MAKIILALYVAFTTSALIILKLGAKAGAPVGITAGKLHFNMNVYSISGIGLYGLSFIVYTYLISKYDLGYIVPLTTALVYIIIFTASYFIFKEIFTATKVIGILFILIGIVFLNLKH